MRRALPFPLTAAAAVAVVVIMAPAGTAQAPAGGRVVITSKPSPVLLRAPRRLSAGPMALARPAFDVVSWFDRTDAPGAPPGGTRSAVILAGDLRLENRQYTLTPTQLVIVADTLRVGPNATIDLSARDMRTGGGRIAIIARHLVCESGGALKLAASGGPQGGSGGAIAIVAGKVDVTAGSSTSERRGRGRGALARPELLGTLLPQGQPQSGGGATVVDGGVPPCITGLADGGAGATIQVRDHRGATVVTSTRTIPPGPGGHVSAPSLRAALQADSFVQTAWSMWVVEWLENLQLSIYDASRRSDYRTVLNLLRAYAEFDAPPDLVSPDMRDRYRAALEDLNTYRVSALPALSVEEVTVSTGVLPRTVAVFTEGATLRASLAPTDALVSRTNSGGRSVLGLIDYQSDHPDELAIEVEWELTVDPWVARLATDRLAKAGQPVDGVFTAWSLEPRPIQELGLRSASATLLAGGRRLRVRFNVDAERANLVFWRLLSSAGIPWTVDWRFSEPNSGRVVTGTWAGPPLTLVHPRDPQVRLSEGGITNMGSSPVTVNYVRAKDEAFVALDPPLRIKPGDTVPLPASASATTAASIPAEAIETTFDPEHFASDFHVLNGEQVVDRVVVKNNLPTSDAARGAFDYLEITVTAAVEGDISTPPAAAGPFSLAAAGTRGSEISIPLLRLSRGARRITIQGTAHYADGSEWHLKPTTFDTLSVSITPDILRQ